MYVEKSPTGTPARIISLKNNNSDKRLVLKQYLGTIFNTYSLQGKFVATGLELFFSSQSTKFKPTDCQGEICGITTFWWPSWQSNVKKFDNGRFYSY